jgi:hypothetical protein
VQFLSSNGHLFVLVTGQPNELCFIQAEFMTPGRDECLDYERFGGQEIRFGHNASDWFLLRASDWSDQAPTSLSASFAKSLSLGNLPVRRNTRASASYSSNATMPISKKIMCLGLALARLARDGESRKEEPLLGSQARKLPVFGALFIEPVSGTVTVAAFKG